MITVSKRVILCRLSGGTSPFAADSDRDTLLKVKEGQWQFDEQEFAQISDDGKDFISGLLNADPRWVYHVYVFNLIKHVWDNDQGTRHS